MLDWASQLARYSAGNYQATIFQFSPRLDPSMMAGLFIGDHATDPRKVWTTPAAIDLLRRSMIAEGPARQAVIDTLDRRFRAEVPAIILYSTRRLTALSTGVQGYHSWQASTQRLWNVGIGRAR